MREDDRRDLAGRQTPGHLSARSGGVPGDVLAREAGRSDETGAWAEKTVDWVLPALADGRFAVRIDADTQTAPEGADDIMRRISL